MLNKIILIIQQIPQLLLGFIVIVVVLFFMLYNDPPKSLCDIQMQEIGKRLSKGFLRDQDRGKFESKITEALNICLKSNSPGGCLDIFERFDFLVEVIETLPQECGAHPASGPLRGFMHEGIRLFARIAWGDKPPINRYNSTGWLDTKDVGLYCRIKQQYIRLYGSQAWKQYTKAYARKLPEAKDLRNKDLWKLSLFSYNCTALY